MKEDRYEFPASEWEHDVEWETVHTGGVEFHNPTKITLTRKKPKVKVEWRRAPSIYRSGAAYEQDDYGQFYIVQFRVTGGSGEISIYTEIDVDGWRFAKVSPKFTKTFILDRETEFERLPIDLVIGLDAREKWSAPVLLPESIFSRLDEICAALESKANEVKG